MQSRFDQIALFRILHRISFTFVSCLYYNQFAQGLSFSMYNVSQSEASPFPPDMIASPRVYIKANNVI